VKTILRNNYKWIIFLLLVSAASLGAELINNRMDMRDLGVYYRAAERLLDGEELYRHAEADPYEHYVYKYAPPAAMLFIPFLPLGITVSSYAYWALLTLVMAGILLILKKLLTGNILESSGRTHSLILAIVITGTHFFRELHLGQVNLLLLGFYVMSIYLLHMRKPAAFGALLAISIFIKPFGLIFLPLLIITGRFRELLYFTGFALLLFLLPMLFYENISDYAGLYVSWYQELGTELGGKQEILSAGNHTIFSILARFTPLGRLPLQGIGLVIYQLSVMLLLGILFLWFYFRKAVPDRALRLFMVLTALIPLLAYTSYNAFIFSLPLLVFLLFRFKELNLAGRIILIISSLLIGGNIYDISGRDLFDYFWSISVYSWGTLGLMLLVFLNWRAFRMHN
jgi:hypothetical protein